MLHIAETVSPAGDSAAEVASAVRGVSEELARQKALTGEITADVERVILMTGQGAEAAAATADISRELDALSRAQPDEVGRFRV